MGLWCVNPQPWARTRKNGGVGKTQTVESNCLGSSPDSSTVGCGTCAICITSLSFCFLVWKVKILVVTSSQVIVRVEMTMESTENRSPHTLSIKDQRRNILGSAGHGLSARLLSSAVVTRKQPGTICKGRMWLCSNGTIYRHWNLNFIYFSCVTKRVSFF